MADHFYTAASFTTKRSIGYLVRRAYKVMLPQVEAMFEGSGFTLSQWIALKTLADGLGDTVSDIARQLCHNSGATTRLVDHLEQLGLVRRVRRSEDRRIVNVEITPAGRAMVETMYPRMMGLWNELLVDFSHDEVESLLGLMTRLVASLERTAESRSHS